MLRLLEQSQISKKQTSWREQMSSVKNLEYFPPEGEGVNLGGQIHFVG